jgi:predicted metal-dependent enzyme (double-stranded beta helix superfamily)
MDDEFILDTPQVRQFIGEVRAALRQHPVHTALELIQPAFTDLLADPAWLPDAYMQGVPAGGMGGGIATWLLYRAGDGGLSLFSLVVPPGSATPVHDHLAWGLVGLYAGEQDERVYRPVGDHSQIDAGHAPLEQVGQQHLRPGDFYLLLPPEGDIHSVATISSGPSVSIHMLGNDTGCTWRHAYSPAEGSARAFRSGWSNRECKGEG